MSSLSSLFSRPLLIYDDKCYSCAKFAKVCRILSRSWIRTAGHYYSEEAKVAKSMIFPPNYDATKMFWLVNKHGAYGARSGILPLVKEIIVGLFRGGSEPSDIVATCEYDGTGMSCYKPIDIFNRLATMLSHGSRFKFEHD